jgi:hypothetical protein
VLDALRPRKEVLRRVTAIKEKLGLGRIVGIHIRRGDFSVAFPEQIVPVENFIAVARDLLSLDPTLNFFVASDDPDIFDLPLWHFPYVCQEKRGRTSAANSFRIFGYHEKSNRDTLAGAREALVDFLLLASTDLIVGSRGSSFTIIASLIGDVPVIVPDSEFMAHRDYWSNLKNLLGESSNS